MTKIPNNDVMRTGSGFSSEVLGMHFSVNLLTGSPNLVSGYYPVISRLTKACSFTKDVANSLSGSVKDIGLFHFLENKIKI